MPNVYIMSIFSSTSISCILSQLVSELISSCLASADSKAFSRSIWNHFLTPPDFIEMLSSCHTVKRKSIFLKEKHGKRC
jgi:hypothetical protein